MIFLRNSLFSIWLSERIQDRQEVNKVSNKIQISFLIILIPNRFGVTISPIRGRTYGVITLCNGKEDHKRERLYRNESDRVFEKEWI